MKNSKKLTRTTLIKLALATITVAFALNASLSISKYLEVRKSLNAINSITVGVTSEDGALKILSPFRDYTVTGRAQIEGNSYETRTIQIENSGMHLMGIFRPFRFGLSVTFGYGVVIEKSAGLFQAPDLSAGTREFASGVLKDPNLDSANSGIIVGVYDPPTRMEVLLDQRASPNARRSAFDYNLSCISAIKRCRSVYDVLPEVKAYSN